MIFHYTASDKNGKITEGNLDIDSLDQALRELAGRELQPISVKPVSVEAAYQKHRIFGDINLTDKIFLTKYLSLMLRVGTDLLSAIDILIADFSKPALRNFLMEVRDNLSRGQPFYAAFARYPKIFSATFVSMIKAAESSGNLQETFDDLSQSLGRQAELKRKVRAALIYPIILLITSVVIFVFLVTFALPRIAKIFIDSGINPPFFSRVVFGIGLYVNAHAIVIMSGFLAILVFLTYFFWKNRVGRLMIQRIFGGIPVIKSVFRDLAVQRFASTTSSLLKAGLPIVKTIEVAANTVGVEEFRMSLERIGQEGLTKGLTIGEAFKREEVFPRLVSNLIAVSEKAGHLEDVLDTVAEFYASQAETSIRSLISFVEPVLLLLMGLLVGLVAISIIVPIYQLTSQF